MSVTQLALSVAFAEGKPCECRNETEAKLARLMLQMAASRLNLELNALIFINPNSKKLYVALDYSNPFDVNPLLGKIHAVADELLKWSRLPLEEVKKDLGLKPFLENRFFNDLAVLTTPAKFDQAEFYDCILKKFHNVSDPSKICSIQQTGNRILLIGNNSTITQVMRLFEDKIKLKARM